MEDRDAAKILVLTHPTYRDESGTPEPADDIDYNGLKQLLSSRFKLVSRRIHLPRQRAGVDREQQHGS